MIDQAASAALYAEDDAETMRFILGHPRGRSFVWGLLAQTNVFGASFTGEPLTTAFNEGRRDAGLRLLQAVLAAEPNAFAVMRAEHEERAKRYHVTTPTDDEEREDL